MFTMSVPSHQAHLMCNKAVSFPAAYNRLLRDFAWRKLWASTKDLLTLSLGFPRRVALDNHDTRLTLFEAQLPQASLNWIAKYSEPDAWAKLHGSADGTSDSTAAELRNCPPRRPCTVNRVVLLGDGMESWNVRLALIRSASQSIQVQYAYIYLDMYGWRFCEELARAAKRGVATSVILDEFGAMSFEFGGENPRHRCEANLPNGRRPSWNDMMTLLLDAGVEVAYWRGTSSVTAEDAMFPTKNHTKTLVVDGNFAILGDRNIGVEYFEDWAGADVLVQGHAASAIQQSFIQDNRSFLVAPKDFKNDDTPLDGQTEVNPTPFTWKVDPLSRTSRAHTPGDSAELNTILQGALHLFKREGNEQDASGTVVVHIPTTSGYDPILHDFMNRVRAAKYSIDIRSCYLVLGKFMQEELAAAAERGVRVRFVTNSKDTNDLMFLHAAMCQSLVLPAERGCHVHMMTETMDHTKFIVIDRQWISIGSWNCWLRTPFYEAETNLVVEDQRMGETLAQLGIDDFLASHANEMKKYSSADLAQEVAEVSRDVCPPDAFHAKFL
eukprot:m.182700 g.182700  ORF g.182700 m.182700 type:complete len:553 (-) comp18468_c0_seq1:182-1840(-)